MRISPIAAATASAAAFALATVACGGATPASEASPETASTVAADVQTAADAPRMRNVILLIGDGMGPQQIGLLEIWARRASSSTYVGPTHIERMADAGTVGLSMTDPVDALVVDSACSATQLATGEAALGEVIGLDAEGNAVPTILELAEARGMATGLVSDTRLTHATPASFAAHVHHRSHENEIAAQMIASGADVLLSGGLRHFVPASLDGAGDDDAAWLADHGVPFDVASRRDDDRDLIAEAVADGYALAFDREQLAAATGGERVLGLFAPSGMMDGIQWHQTVDDPARAEPTLTEMTVAALDILEDDPDGFFLMVEGGQIDWAGHDNDAGRLLHEMRKYDDAIGAVLAWAEGRDDTLIVLTADHETGGFGLSYSAFDVPVPVTIAGDGFAGAPYQPNFNFGDPSQLDGLFAQTLSLEGMLAEVGDDAAPDALMAVVNEHSAFDITEAEATEILAMVPNAYHVEGHSYLDAEELPHVHDFAAFYPFGLSSRRGLIGRALATQQNVVWASGTHTHTPVAVVAWGPEPVRRAFGGLTHHVAIGQTLVDVLTAE